MSTATITDDDLRDLFWRMGMSPGEIEVHLANPYAAAYTKMFLEVVNQRVAELLAQRIVKKLFPDLKAV